MPVYRVTVAGKAYNVEVSNPREQPVTAIVDGEPIEVWIEENLPAVGGAAAAAAPVMAVAPAPGAAVAATAQSGDVTAPLPGVVTVIAVAVGDAVKPGQELCILEAMKMNNPIRTTRGGVVQAVYVTVGQQVQHGTPLFRIAD